jgi:hypothetical protein
MADFGITEIVALASLAATAVGTGVGVYSSVNQAQKQSNLAEAQSQALEQQAQSQQEAAAYEERQFRRKAAFLIGKQHAIYGASGLDTLSGSPLTQELDTVRQSEIEALNIRRGGDVAASSSRFEAGLAKYRANFYESSIAPTIIGGAASLAGSTLSSWMKYSQTSRPTGYGYF